jgi:import inner membrane translocase subunit TIM50
MLSRAVLPLTRPNVLASAARVGSLSAQRPRWYAKGKDNAPYKLPDHLQQKKAADEPKQNQHASEQPEFDTQAKPETEASEPTVRYTCHLV